MRTLLFVIALLISTTLKSQDDPVSFRFKYNCIANVEIKTDHSWRENVCCFVFDYDGNDNIVMVNGGAPLYMRVVSHEAGPDPSLLVYHVLDKDGAKMDVVLRDDLSMLFFQYDNGNQWIFSNQKF